MLKAAFGEKPKPNVIELPKTRTTRARYFPALAFNVKMPDYPMSFAAARMDARRNSRLSELSWQGYLPITACRSVRGLSRGIWLRTAQPGGSGA